MNDPPIRRSETSSTTDNVLLKCLEMEWQDHFQTRAQTWKTLEIEAILAIGLVGIDWQLDKKGATSLAALLLVVATFFGILITRRHRDVEVEKFTNIIEFERRLGLFEAGLLPRVKPPQPIRLIHALTPGRTNTSLFILRMHLMLMAFAIIYGIARLIG